MGRSSFYKKEVDEMARKTVAIINDKDKLGRIQTASLIDGFGYHTFTLPDAGKPGKIEDILPYIHPDLVLIDFDAEHPAWLVGKIKDLVPKAKVLIFSDAILRKIHEWSKAGADNVLLKCTRDGSLKEAIKMWIG